MNRKIERVAFRIYREFIRNGTGSCIRINGKAETPEQAVIRRWKRLSPEVKQQFIDEAEKQKVIHRGFN